MRFVKVIERMVRDFEEMRYTSAPFPPGDGCPKCLLTPCFGLFHAFRLHQ